MLDYPTLLTQLREVLARSQAVLKTVQLIDRLPVGSRAAALGELSEVIAQTIDLAETAICEIDDRLEATAMN